MSFRADPSFHNAGDGKGQGPIWGTDVNVPPGGKTPHFATNGNGNAKPTETSTDTGDDTSTDKGDEGGSSTTQPIVVMPDGTKVSVDAFYAQQSAKDQEELNTLKGKVEAYEKLGTQTQTSTGDEKTETTEPESLWKSFEFKEDTRVEANEKEIVDFYNAQGQAMEAAFTEQFKKMSAANAELKTELEGVKDIVGKEVFESNMSRVVATTGISRDELLEMYSRTKVGDADVLSTLVLGERAKKEQQDKIAEAAEKEREQGTNAIAGQSQSGGSQGDDINKPGRGIEVEDGAMPTPAQLAEKYNLTAPMF
ncbi:MAG: hypothetical protein F4118_10080 [Acidimicrobiaceae bacterium]|nr:hypothetical protein [Candidatus Poribacteria bacterium]MYI36756.1 hypothetical protein [Acidimicrobiaceae bacterium]